MTNNIEFQKTWKLSDVPNFSLFMIFMQSMLLLLYMSISIFQIATVSIYKDWTLGPHIQDPFFQGNLTTFNCFFNPLACVGFLFITVTLIKNTIKETSRPILFNPTVGRPTNNIKEINVNKTFLTNKTRFGSLLTDNAWENLLSFLKNSDLIWELSATEVEFYDGPGQIDSLFQLEHSDFRPELTLKIEGEEALTWLYLSVPVTG